MAYDQPLADREANILLDGQSPRTIMTGRKLNHKKHFRLPFGDYVQVHEQEEPRNSNKERTMGAICLGPMDNLQGGCKLMSLRAGKKLKCCSWTEIPLMQEAINCVITLGKM